MWKCSERQKLWYGEDNGARNAAGCRFDDLFINQQSPISRRHGRRFIVIKYLLTLGNACFAKRAQWSKNWNMLCTVNLKAFIIGSEEIRPTKIYRLKPHGVISALRNTRSIRH